MNTQQKAAIEAFLLIDCKKGGCQGPWCTAQARLREAFDYPENWKAKSSIEQHHAFLKQKAGEFETLAHQKLSAENLVQLSCLTSEFGHVASCLYYNHYKPSVVEIPSGDKEGLRGVIASGEEFVVTSEKGSRIFGAFLGGPFIEYNHSLCGVCA